MVITKNSYTRVTLALDIVGTIDEGPYAGYHELAAIKHGIDLCDRITIQESAADVLECDDPAVPCDSRNICLQAVALLRKEYAINRHVRIGITKRIPVMGGLAGGSANAATTLMIINELWGLGLARPRLMELGRKLGMDVPFYFAATTAFDSEAGGTLTPIPTNSSFVFVLAIPDFGVSTRDAYRGIDYTLVNRNRSLSQALRDGLVVDDRNAVIRSMHNDFELSVFRSFPRLSALKQELIDAGCAGACMTGSGSTVIGIASDRLNAEKIASRLDCRTIIAATREE